MSPQTPTTYARLGADSLAQIGPTRFDVVGARFFNDDGGAPGGPAPAAPAAPAPTPPPAGEPAAPAAPAVPAPPASAEKVEDLPEWAQKVIRDARKEAGDHRTAAKTAADDAQKAITDKLAVALGLKPDAALDPAALTASLTAAQTAHRQSQTQLAVYKAAGAAGANPDALLDSNTFLASVQSLDPASPDFSTKVAEAITAAVTANPTLKAARAAGASTVETPGGTGEQGQITEAQLAQMTPEQIADAYDKGLLKSLLT
ncbi:hypothetical protein [Microbacterium sp. MYb64]|uniref:hypothetical protein n=1 Tax=Microbacterium sp. MYb64 TaxID=1848691 RepID=UPI000D4F5818|nr:hypothetical protein [Microbacterium sp. MYb64]PRB01760.1 hypothetical protein CQ044_16560 [Microbacterium sp. MYb64]